MIVRMWHGRVPASKSRAYREFLNQGAIPDYQSVTGNISVYILERHEEKVAHFITMTFWENMDVIRGLREMRLSGRNTTRKTKISYSNSSLPWFTTKW